MAFRWLFIALLSAYFGYCSAADDVLQCRDMTERLTADAPGHDGAQEVHDLDAIGHSCRWALTTGSSQLIERVIEDSDRAPLESTRVDLLQMLFDVRWHRPDGSEPSRAWRQLSLGLLDRQQPQEAFAVAAQIVDPYDLIALQADKRYARIERSKFVEDNILKATRKELERRRAAAAERPRNLARLADVGRYLLLLHDYPGVLELTDPLIAGGSSGSPAASRYDDFEHELPWILDVRSRALRALGRHEEALELLRRASAVSKDDPVSHGLNLAVFLAKLNEPREALAAIPNLEHASPRGRAVAAYVRVIATSELNDSAGLDSALAELRSAGQEGMRERALLVAGRVDEAASVLLARLSNPDQRTDALVELQNYADPSAPPLVLAWRERAKTLQNRPEVHRLIGTYGRIRSYPIPTNSDF